MPPTVRKTDDSRHDLVGNPHRHFALEHTTLEHRRLAITQPGAPGIKRIDEQNATVFAGDKRFDIVHPRVVRTKVAPPYHQ